MEKVSAAVVGATGYTGAELLRLLLGHPRVEVTKVVGHSRAGEPVGKVLPNLRGLLTGDVDAFDADAIAASSKVAFCALPHGASASIVDVLRRLGVVVFDLSADFRLKDLDVYRTWYGDHPAPERHAEAVYGLVELHRDELRGTDLVAVPGCYPTASTLALAPLLRAGLVESTGIVIDAKSGVSGAGRTPTGSTHLPESSEGIRAYKTGGTHRHVPEIEQELSLAAGGVVRLVFTPHLVPMTRGILVTAYAQAKGASTAEACTRAARELYQDSPSVVVLDPGENPDTLWVRGSNRVFISYTRNDSTGHVIAQAAIDNLVKGAAGSAIQAANVALGLEETAGLRTPGVFPA
ncbi:MAG: N-acetyl-gamma-glutamyl-phosphate reductase [Myxococcales bacterium]|nr:N-acetyl-gamma-glutamyl-phosphate reductase [Myxococcales bacterium]